VLAKDKRETAAKIMAKSYVKSPVEASINAYIILLGGRTILVDAGSDLKAAFASDATKDRTNTPSINFAGLPECYS
jgi:hypothetical protein